MRDKPILPGRCQVVPLSCGERKCCHKEKWLQIKMVTYNDHIPLIPIILCVLLGSNPYFPFWILSGKTSPTNSLKKNKAKFKKTI